jgi:hypothetical protein
MEGTCIALRPHLTGDPRTLHIGATLHLDPPAVIGTLYALGAYAQRYGVTAGDESDPEAINRCFIPFLNAHQFDAVLGTTGLAAALAAVDWLAVGADGITIHAADWCALDR